MNIGINSNSTSIPISINALLSHGKHGVHHRSRREQHQKTISADDLSVSVIQGWKPSPPHTPNKNTSSYVIVHVDARSLRNRLVYTHHLALLPINHQPFRPFVHPSIHRSIDPSVHPTIHPSMHHPPTHVSSVW